MKVSLRGKALLEDPLLNKGTAFTHAERAAFGLEGLLPHHVLTIEEQSIRMVAAIERKSDALEKYIGLASLQDRNEVLFYRVLLDRLEEYLPIVYTPTVGLACQRFSEVFRRPRGVWITPAHRGHICEILASVCRADVRLIVVTDNERILGLGDQGAGGMGIPVGKLALYTAAAGIPPAHTLPVSLDVGTDNPDLLADPLYLGWQQPRLRGAAYDELVEEFVQAVRALYPGALLQWEDFKKGNAFRLLARYQDVLPSFNDDIQGTAATAVAGVLAAVRATSRSLPEHRIVMLGAGAAGVGIARQLRDVLTRAGLTGDALVRAVAVLDSGGLLVDSRDLHEPHKVEFAWPAALARSVGLDPRGTLDLDAVIKAMKPTVLIGTSGQPGAFTASAVRAMAAHVERPAIFPLSNPTSKSEAHPANLLAWSEGRALIATGSPFDPVEHEGQSHHISQCNNVYVFPGIGLGVLVSGAKRVTNAMFSVAAETLADLVSDAHLAGGALFPPLRDLRTITARIAEAVVREARDCGLGTSLADAEIPERVRSSMWEPVYPIYEPAAAELEPQRERIP